MAIESAPADAWNKTRPAAWHDWRWQYANRIRTLSQLSAALGEPVENFAQWQTVLKDYPFAITPYYFSLINRDDPNDPLRRQCFPDLKEVEFSQGGTDDPLEEHRQMPVAGLVHRYADRCLILTTNTCAVYCRHCNRKRLWGDKRTTDLKSWFQPMIDHIAAAPPNPRGSSSREAIP